MKPNSFSIMDRGKELFRLILFVMISVLTITPQPILAQKGKIVFKLMEELPTDTPIGNVAEKSGIKNDVDPAVFDALRYQILSSDGLRISSLFTINSVTSALFTNAMINREKVCDSTTVTCSLEFDVTVTSGVNVIRLLNVVVEIQDKNDNAPSFPSTILPLSVSEAAAVKSEISISGAIDKDTGLNSVITYWMDTSDTFGLREVKILRTSILKLVLLKQLDREVESGYMLNIYAKDGDTNGALTGTLTVNITVTDVNDHDPKFTDNVFNFTVKEDARPNDFVGRIVAVDLDAGENGEVVYTFSSLTPTKVLQLFSLDSSSGEITVRSGLEYEANKEFQAVVEAKDKGGSPRASQAVLKLDIIDAGNTPPKLSLTLAEPLFQGTTLLSEGLPVGKFVGTLKYLDNDEGTNGEVECLSMNPHFSLQSLEDNGYGIVIKQMLDREFETEIKVKLKCSDKGEPSLSSYVNFTVIVEDTNDNSPKFIQTTYTIFVSEGVASKPNLIKVSATDRDEGQNGEVMYQLTTNSSNSFSINPFTGSISLIDFVDREAGPDIELTVLGVDKGSTPLTGSVMVKVTIDDINDNSPEIIRFEYSARENAGPGTYVSNIVATDKDAGKNGEVAFSLLSDPSNAFTVSQDGIITTKKELDREYEKYYFITVSVRDKGTPSLSSTGTLSIRVLDTNDHKPQVIFPTTSNGTVSVSANLSPGSFVAKAEASDEDTGKNGKLMYLIVEGNTHKVFTIDNSTGMILISKRLTMFRETFYRLTILIQDGGNPRMYTEAYLKIKVDFTNATRLSYGAEKEQKYIIIAGIISGITIVIAIIVIAIIIKMKRAEPRLNPPRNGKPKENGHLAENGSKIRSEVQIPTTLSPGFKVQQTEKDSGFDAERSLDLDNNISFDSHLSSNNVTFTQRSAMTKDYVEKHSAQFFNHEMEGRHQLPSEDIRSDTSGETTTSDSGRGASDAEDAAVGANSSLTFQNKHAIQKHVPQLPPREPFQISSTPIPTATNSAPNVMYPTTSQPNNGMTTFGDISRAERAYASQKYFDKPKKIPGKVRFSFDDQNIADSRHLNSHVVHYQPQVQNQPQTQNSCSNKSSILSRNTPSSSSSSSPSQLTSSLSSPYYPSHSESEPNDLSRFTAPINKTVPHKTSTDKLSVHQPNISNSLPTYSQTIQNNKTLHCDDYNKQRSNPQNRYQPTHNINPYRQTNNKQLSGGVPLQEKLPLKSKHTGGRSGNNNYNSKNVSYPLLRPPRSSLPLNNISVDEEDDDGGSTTTSGSYAIEDQLNVSVEC